MSIENIAESRKLIDKLFPHIRYYAEIKKQIYNTSASLAKQLNIEFDYIGGIAVCFDRQIVVCAHHNPVVNKCNPFYPNLKFFEVSNWNIDTDFVTKLIIENLNFDFVSFRCCGPSCVIEYKRFGKGIKKVYQCDTEPYFLYQDAGYSWRQVNH